MNAHFKPPSLYADAEYLLAALRCASRRLKLIDEEVILIGLALQKGLITSQEAVASDRGDRTRLSGCRRHFDEVDGMSDWKTQTTGRKHRRAAPVARERDHGVPRGAIMVWRPCL